MLRRNSNSKQITSEHIPFLRCGIVPTGRPMQSGDTQSKFYIEGLWLQPKIEQLPELRVLPLEPLFLAAAKKFFQEKKQTLYRVLMDRLLSDCTLENSSLGQSLDSIVMARFCQLSDENCNVQKFLQQLSQSPTAIEFPQWLPASFQFITSHIICCDRNLSLW